MEKIKIKVSELVTKNGWSEDRFKEYLEMEIELDLIKGKEKDQAAVIEELAKLKREVEETYVGKTENILRDTVGDVLVDNVIGKDNIEKAKDIEQVLGFFGKCKDFFEGLKNAFNEGEKNTIFGLGWLFGIGSSIKYVFNYFFGKRGEEKKEEDKSNESEAGQKESTAPIKPSQGVTTSPTINTSVPDVQGGEKTKDAINLSEEADKIKELPVNIIIPGENQPVKFGLTEDGKGIYLGEKKYKLELFYKKQSVLEKISFKEKKFFIELTSLASAGNLIASLFSPSSDEGDKEVQRKLKGGFLPSELFRSVGNKVDDIFNLEIKKEMRFFEPYEKNPDENYIRLTRIS